ncbi:MAG TPA: hypothetical protein VGW36_09955, partial [Pyrinomonadaceae bacterium]|nr:hypothetical protein [Pyrinomonadaceae bacterium]
MSKTIGRLLVSFMVLIAAGVIAMAQSSLTAKTTPYQPASGAAPAATDRMRDGLMGPVRRVRTEIVKLSNENGKMLEGKHAVLEIV